MGDPNLSVVASVAPGGAGAARDARERTSPALTSDEAFQIFGLDYLNALLLDVHTAYLSKMLDCHPDKTGHLANDERESKTRDFHCVRQVLMLQSDESLKKQLREVCEQHPSYEEDRCLLSIKR